MKGTEDWRITFYAPPFLFSAVPDIRRTESETTPMKKNTQTILLGLAISLILTALGAGNAETPKAATAQVHYSYYYYSYDDLVEFYGFLPSPAPEGLHYHVRMRATANIDDTPGKETVSLIVVETKPRTLFSSGTDFGNQSHAFLLIANRKGGKLQKKAFFKLFDTSTHPLEVPAATPIELHNRSVVFSEIHEAAHKPDSVSFRLVDLTDDGTLDVWVESDYGVVLISFANGEFKEVLTNYTVTPEKLAETPEIESYGYADQLEPAGQKYHSFLGNPLPQGASYFTRSKTIVNIDDTPEKEMIVLMVTNSDDEWRAWSEAFLLITEPETETIRFPKTKELFGLFGGSFHDLNVPGKTIEVQSAPFIFRGPLGRGGPWAFKYVFFDLVDLTGDGILDIWVEHAQGVAVISFQEGEFVEVCSAYSSHHREDPIEYVDLDKDGICEIKIPDKISNDAGPTASGLEWMSLYEWDGNTYVLNNDRFYAENDEFLTRLLEKYNFGHPFTRNEIYHFYIGLVYYYQDNAARAREFLQRVVEHGKKQDYIQAAEKLLKNLPPH